MNAYEYGQKLARNDEETTNDALGLGAAAGGAYALSQAAPRVTGRTSLHHGTTPALKKKILEEGLKPSAAVSSPSLTEHTIPSDLKQKAKSLAYMSDSPFEARTYAGQAEFLARGGNPVLDGVDRAVAAYSAGVPSTMERMAVPVATARQRPLAAGSSSSPRKTWPKNLASVVLSEEAGPVMEVKQAPIEST